MFLKLFRLAQLLLEYLLSVQDNLAASVESLTGQNRNIQEQCEKTQNELKRYEKIISSLRMEVRKIIISTQSIHPPTHTLRCGRNIEQLRDTRDSWPSLDMMSTITERSIQTMK